MLCRSQNGCSWFGLDNRPWQFVRSWKWWGGVRDGWKYGWHCLTVRSSKVKLIKFWNMDNLLNFINVASIKSKQNYQNIVTWGKNTAYFCLIKHRSLWEDYLVVCPLPLMTHLAQKQHTKENWNCAKIGHKQKWT